MMTRQTNTNYLKGMQLFTMAMMAGTLMLAGIVWLMPVFDPVDASYLQPYAGIVFYIAAGVGLVAYLLARWVFSSKMRVIQQSSVNVTEKLNRYRAAFISYMALCEGPAIVAILLVMLTNNSWLLAIAGLLLWAMVVKFPRKQRLINDMALDWQEQQQLE